jgi:hypothetical protein
MKEANIHVLWNIIFQSYFYLVNILRRGSVGILKDHPSSGDLLIARIQPSVVQQLSWSL